MTWLVFGVSGLLVLAGAVAITFGAPIVQLERGWAEVISGSIALSSGGVVFALGVVLMRLQDLRDAVAETAPSGVGFAVRDVPLETLAALAETDRAVEAPKPPAAPPVPEPAPSVVDETREFASDQVLWKRIRRPADARDTAVAYPEPSLSPAAMDTRPRESTTPEPQMVEDVRPEPRPLATNPAPGARSLSPVPEPTVPAGEDAAQLGWLERSLIRGRGERVEPPLGDAAVNRSPMTAGSPPMVEAVAAETLHPHPEVATPDEGPVVIGRYQAGVASYIMYSDGTIEVETEGGQSHRFGSMDELKAFIANQDKADA